MQVQDIMSHPVFTVKGGRDDMITVDDIARQWDNDQAIVLLARRVAPRRKGCTRAGRALIGRILRH